MATADQPRHVLQRQQAPADGQPDQCGEDEDAGEVRPQGMTDDALHQVLAHVVALAHPDQQALATVR
ncbi:hypothetical protein D3C77_666030 [compost metagenome]